MIKLDSIKIISSLVFIKLNWMQAFLCTIQT